MAQGTHVEYTVKASGSGSNTLTVKAQQQKSDGDWSFPARGARRQGLHFCGELRPTGGGVGETELGGDGAGVIDDDDVVMAQSRAAK